MSLTDPALRRSESLRGQLGQPRMLIVGLTALAALGIAAAATGAVTSMLFDEMRHGTIDSVFDGRRTLAEVHPFLLPAGTVAGVLIGIAGLPLYFWAITRYRGGDRPWPLPVPVTVLGYTAGFIALVPAWTGPLEVGVRSDPVFHHDRTWGWGSWVFYRANVWVPLLLLIISAVVVLWVLRTSQARAAQERLRDRLLVEGARVRGDVAEVRVHLGSDDTGASRPSGATVTVRYVDGDSRSRWVERFTRATDLRVGADAAEVLFDPLRPDDEKSTFVTFRHEPVPGDWIGPKSR